MRDKKVEINRRGWKEEIRKEIILARTRKLERERKRKRKKERKYGVQESVGTRVRRPPCLARFVNISG